MNLLYTLPAAFGLGALHSMEPGHGKSVLTAYLVSIKAKPFDAILVGLITAFAHSASIVLLAYVTSTTIERFSPENLSHWITLLAGILVLVLGLRMIYLFLFPRMITIGKLRRDGEHHDVHPTEPHKHHLHYHPTEKPRSLIHLILIGLFIGIVPCPSALAIYLTSISIGQYISGFEVILFFSFGSAVTMTTIGLLAVKAKNSLHRFDKVNFQRPLQFISSLLIILLGCFMTIQAIELI